MSAGCIPFLQDEYAGMFKPALINGENAITFSDECDLQSKIADLFSLGNDDIKRMRDSVLTY